MLPGGGVFLFDCGEGTVRQMLRGTVSPLDVRALFITHLHGDHCYGVPGLGMTMLGLEKGKEQPFLFAPKGLEECYQGPMGLRGFQTRPILKPNNRGSIPENVCYYGILCIGHPI
jgi:ribonuclease Z